MAEDKIRIRLPNARDKLQQFFPDDVRGDVKIVYGKATFKLQKPFLRLQSGYFKRYLTQTTDLLQIKPEFKEEYFVNILKCFYGFTIEIARSQIMDYYPVIKFLDVELLLKLLRQDMNSKAEQYDIFVLMQLAHRYDQQEIFETCLMQLQKEGYEQLRYAKHELLHCPTELFKMIIKTHNRTKSDKNRGIQYTQIDQLIKDFSEEKRLTESQYQQLKFDLIDKRSLTSQEYKEIFLDDVKRKKSGIETRSMMRLQPDANLLYSNIITNNTILTGGKLTESVIEPMKKINDELTLQMENTFEKKKNQELQAENSFLLAELKSLKETTIINQNNYDRLNEQVQRIHKQLQLKDKTDKEQQNIIKRLEKMCLDLKKELAERGEAIKKLQDKVAKIQKQPEKKTSSNPKYLPYDEEEESKTIQSQIFPGHLLKDIAKPVVQITTTTSGFKKAKPTTAAVVVEAKPEEQYLDDQQIEELYQSRLEFDREPRGCPKRLLPKLANFLTSDGFQKKKLELIFRRSSNNQQSVGTALDIRNKTSILVLICTKTNLVIGGFVSIEIQKNSCDYLSDESAFVFSLTKNQKFPVKKSAANEAVFISTDYLLCFSNDLMISFDPVKQQSECSWPCAYESGGEKRTSKWLTGEESSFSIKQIEVYEVKEEEMIMDL